MKTVCLMLVSSAAMFAQQPVIENAKLETRTVSGSVASELAKLGAGPYWVGWAEPIIAGQHGEYCSWNRNNDSGRVQGSPVRLEGETALVMLTRVENGRAGETRISSPDCRLDGGGLAFYWLNGVSAGESVAWLKTQVEGNRGEQAVAALALHQGTAADQALDDLTALNEPAEVRKRAAFWLGNARGAHGVARLKAMLAADPNPDVRDRVVFALSQSKDPAGIALVLEAARSDKDGHIRGQALMWLAQKASSQVSATAIQNAIDSDPETAVREKAVMALAQMPNGEGVPKLIELARTHRDMAVRKKAMFWLGQSKDPRALEYFAQVLRP